MLQLLMLVAGMLGVLGLGYFAVAGPSPDKARARRLESVRERHRKSDEIAAQAQMKRILATRDTKMDTALQRFIPNPALLRRRIEQTGKSWTLSH